MNKELFKVGKKYRYPSITCDLTFFNLNEPLECLEFCCSDGIDIKIPFNKMSKITPVKEYLKKEVITFSLANLNLDASLNGSDRVIGLRIFSNHYSKLTNLIYQKKQSYSNDSRFDELVIVKTIAYSEEMTEEDILKQREQERINAIKNKEVLL